MKLTTHLSTPWGWKAELALLADLQRTVYPYKWLAISCRSGADQWKFADQRPTFYHWATQPTKITKKQLQPWNVPDSKPFSGGTVTKWEDLRRKVMLLQLSSLAQIPQTYRVVQSACPQLGSIRRDINTTSAICVSLELSVHSHISYVFT